MRGLLEILLIAVLVTVGWNRPFRAQMPGSRAPGAVQKVEPNEENIQAYSQMPGASEASSSAPRDNSWMWERGTLDRPVNRR